MKKDYINIYNNLIKLTRNKKLFLKLEKQDTFSDRLILLFFHFSFFIKAYKSDISKIKMQEIFDYVIRQIELSIREIGYGDVSVNKKMKQYINLFYSIVDKVERWDEITRSNKLECFESYLNIDKNHEFYLDYFDNYYQYLLKNTLNNFTKDIIQFKF